MENEENVKDYDYTKCFNSGSAGTGSVDLTREQTRTLVLLYEQHPCLYVQKSEDYHNREKRLKALQTIAQQLCEVCGCVININMIKKKIASLRTQYLEQINKIQKSKSSGVGTDNIYKPTWWLFEELSFLAPHVASRKGESSISKSIVAKSYIGLSTCEENEYKENIDDLLFIDVQRALGSKNNISKKDFSNSTSIKTENSLPKTSFSDVQILGSRNNNSIEDFSNSTSIKIENSLPKTSFSDVQILGSRNNNSIEDFCNSTCITTENSLPKTSSKKEETCSETTSVSVSHTTFDKRNHNKKRKTELNENTPEEFWTNINCVLKNINKDDHTSEDDGLHNRMLFLKSDLKNIKNRRRLRKVQADILNLVEEALDDETM